MTRRRNAIYPTGVAVTPPLEWLHVNCALFRNQQDGSLYVPWQRLSTALEDWHVERRFEICFFSRKPPGLRLRFRGADLYERLEPQLTAWLDAAERRNDLRSFRFAIYEPETFRFGGPTGMAITHDLFDRDSRTTMMYETLPEPDLRGLPRSLFSLFLTNDLFARALDDRAEIWDVWQRLAEKLGTPNRSGEISDIACARAREAVTLSSDFKDKLSSAARELVDQGSENNAHVAEQLRAVNSAGRLSIGLRAWLTETTVFHWNRLGLTSADLDTIVATMIRLLCPHEIER